MKTVDSAIDSSGQYCLIFLFVYKWRLQQDLTEKDGRIGLEVPYKLNTPKGRGEGGIQTYYMYI